MIERSTSESNSGVLFLVGALRSGTTMLRLMIDAHPQITFPGEFEFVTPMITDKGDFPPLQDYHDFLRKHRGFKMNDFSIDSNLNFVELCRSFLTQRQQQPGTRFIGSTVHNFFSRLPYIWPEARYIRLARDGRDVARSFIPMGWAGNVYYGVNHWIKSEREWTTFKKTIPNESWIELKFEQLLENPVIELTRICDFIGVTFDENMLSYPQHTSYSAPDPSCSYQWKRKQSDIEIRLVESKIGKMLEERGYELSGLKPIVVRPLMLFKLWFQNKAYIMYFKMKRYGIFRTLLELLLRKLRFRRLHERVKNQIDHITIQYLK